MLKEDAEKMRAKELHELLRAWENYHRIITNEAHPDCAFFVNSRVLNRGHCVLKIGFAFSLLNTLWLKTISILQDF